MKRYRDQAMKCGLTGPGRKGLARREDAGQTKTMILAMLLILGTVSVCIAILVPRFEDVPDARSVARGEGPLATSDHPITPASIPRFIYVPILSDVTTASFTISWVSDQPVNASVEYCVSAAGTCDQNNFPVSHSVAYDSSEFLPSGAALIRTRDLTPGTTFYYRAFERNASGGQNYSPNSAPYPSVTIKTDTNIQVGNPTFNVAPYYDKDNDYQWNATKDVKQHDFLLYLNHTGAEALVSRGSGGSGWICTIDSNNMRSATAGGAPHSLSSGNLVTFFIVGLYDNGTGNAIWSNWTASYTIPNPKVSPVDLVERTEVTVPDLASPLILASASIVTFIALASLRGRHRRLICM